MTATFLDRRRASRWLPLSSARVAAPLRPLWRGGAFLFLAILACDPDPRPVTAPPQFQGAAMLQGPSIQQIVELDRGGVWRIDDDARDTTCYVAARGGPGIQGATLSISCQRKVH